MYPVILDVPSGGVIVNVRASLPTIVFSRVTDKLGGGSKTQVVGDKKKLSSKSMTSCKGGNIFFFGRSRLSNTNVVVVSGRRLGFGAVSRLRSCGPVRF